MAVTEHTVEIRYGSDFASNYFSFSGMPTPYLSRSQEMVYYGKKYCQISNITLNGQIIGSEPVAGENLNTISLLNDRKKIFSGFAESFQRLGIYENNTLRKQFFGCMIRDIDFSPANYGIQDYSISLDCIEDGDTFLGTYGVLEPVESVDFTDNKDGTISISHQVSAQGFTTNTFTDSEMAIVKAKNFVESRTGYRIEKIIPQFMGGLSDTNLVINDITKTINRVDGSYSCSIDYVIQTGSIGEIPISAGYVNTIDTTVSSGSTSDYLQVSVNYNVKGDKYASVSDIQNNAPTTGILFKIATGAAGIENLNPIPLNLSVNDNSEADRTLEVSASFDGNTIFTELGTGVFFDYNVDVTTDDVSDTATVNINGEIRARGNNRAQFDLKSGHYFNFVSGKLFDFANEIYTGINYNKLYSNIAWPLNPIASNQSVDFDEKEGTVSCSAAFDNQDFKANYKTFTYGVDVTPALNQYAAKASCNENGVYGVYNLNANIRERVSLNLNSQANADDYNYNSFNFLADMHSYADDLRLSFTTNSDLVIESETSNSPKINPQQQLFDSSITQVYNFVNNTSFYQ